MKEEFKDFYTSMFQKSYEQENKQVAFLEYAWDMSNCDPCAANPLTREELQQAGVFWLNLDANFRANPNVNNAFITRLHVRYNRDNFPEDLRFQTTSDRSLFQGRYVIRHPFKGEATCSAAQEYQQRVRDRQEQEAQTLARLTGWQIDDIRSKINFVAAEETPWWRRIWN